MKPGEDVSRAYEPQGDPSCEDSDGDLAVHLTFEQAETWLRCVGSARIYGPATAWMDLALVDSDEGSSIFGGDGRVEIWLKRDPFLGAKLVRGDLIVETDDGPLTISPR